MFRDNLLVPSSRVENPKESVLSQCRVYTGKNVGSEKTQCEVSANWVDASGWERGENGG